jgi:hypothetical protein
MSSQEKAAELVKFEGLLDYLLRCENSLAEAEVYVDEEMIHVMGIRKFEARKAVVDIVSKLFAKGA